jgi:hypothetical protein
MIAHYEIDHYPNMETQLFVVVEGETGRTMITPNYTLGQAELYVSESFKERGQVAELTRRYEDGALFIRSQNIEVTE